MHADESDGGERGLERSFRAAFVHRVHFSSDVAAPQNPLLDELFASALLPQHAGAPGTRREPDAAHVLRPPANAQTFPPKGLLIVDEGLHAAQPGWAGRLSARLVQAGVRLHAETLILPGGEKAKDGFHVVERVIRAIDAAHICRWSYVIVAGGGAVLDAVGFAASTAHRGVRLVRLPSTTLAQDDAGIGVKNGVNMRGKKNLVGVFDVPFAVINDLALLSSLSERDWRSGFSEAVKVAALKDPAFFAMIENNAEHIAARSMSAAEPVIRRSAQLHFEHIVDGGDPFERQRARPLDFGHWAAHRLETMTRHRLLHGEAVAIGMALDCRYAVHTGMLSKADAERVLCVLEALGFSLSDEAMDDVESLLPGVEDFREHLGGSLAVTMLRGIGQSVEIDAIDPELVRAAAADVRQRRAPAPRGAGVG